MVVKALSLPNVCSLIDPGRLPVHWIDGGGGIRPAGGQVRVCNDAMGVLGVGVGGGGGGATTVTTVEP